MSSVRVILLGFIPLALGACSPGNGGGPDGSAEHPTIIVSSDAPRAMDALSADAGSLHAGLRLALLSPLGFGVDVCVQATPTSVFLGPLLNPQLPSAPDSGAHDARAKDAATPRDGTVPSDATADAREDAKSDGTDNASADGARESAAPDARGGSPDGSDLDGSEDGRREASGDGATVDARGPDDASPDAPLLVDGGQRVGGVLFGQVSSYLSVALAGTMYVSIVRGGSTTCGESLTPMRRVTLDPGKLYTLAVLRTGGLDGDAGLTDGGNVRDGAVDAHIEAAAAELALSVVVLTDEPEVSASFARARFFNGLLSSDGSAAPPVSVSAVEGASSVALALDVPSLAVAAESPSAPAVDSLGYWQGSPLVSTTPIGLRVAPIAVLHGDSGSFGWVFASTSSFDLQHAASNHSGFLVGNPGPQVALVWCDDGASIADAGRTLTSCSLLSQ
jgi:hypothetical protein